MSCILNYGSSVLWCCDQLFYFWMLFSSVQLFQLCKVSFMISAKCIYNSRWDNIHLLRWTSFVLTFPIHEDWWLSSSWSLLWDYLALRVSSEIIKRLESPTLIMVLCIQLRQMEWATDPTNPYSSPPSNISHLRRILPEQLFASFSSSRSSWTWSFPLYLYTSCPTQRSTHELAGSLCLAVE